MPDWTQFLGVCPHHPHTLVHPTGGCVSCLREAETTVLEQKWRGKFIQSVFEKRAQKLAEQRSKKAAKADIREESKLDLIKQELPYGTKLVGTKFTYEIISKEPSEILTNRKSEWRVRVRNLTTKSTRWLNVSTIRSRLRRGDWELELP